MKSSKFFAATYLFGTMLSWQVRFISTTGAERTLYRSRNFTDSRELERFVKRMPEGKYECSDSRSGEFGTCEIIAKSIR